MDISQERRHYPRHEIGLVCNISDTSEDFQASTLDISQRGIACILPDRIPLFTILKIKLSLPIILENEPEATEDHEKVECSGVVVRCSEFNEESTEKGFVVAVFFNHIDESNVKKIEHYLDNSPNLPQELV